MSLTLRLQKIQFCLIIEHLLLTELGTKTRHESTTHFRPLRKIAKKKKYRLLALSYLPVCPPIRPSFVSAYHHSAPDGQIFIEFDIWVFFENLLRNFKLSLKLDENNGDIPWKHTHTHINTVVLISPYPDQEGNKLMFLSECREFPSAPCLAEKNLDDSSRLDVVEIARVHDMLPSFFLFGRAKDLSASRYLCTHFWSYLAQLFLEWKLIQQML